VTYDESIEWLYSTQAFGIKLGLENIQRLLGALDLPGDHAHVLHVAGSNGKGSTCAFAESICRHHGLRTGLFSSPHLVRANERTRIDFEPVSDDGFVSLAKEVKAAVDGWDPHPTFFELVLAMALLHFRREKVDVILLETGMGGRLDATSAVQSTASAIAPIALDHTHWLGDTLAAIAGEKAGILKPSIPLVVSAQKSEADAVIAARAKELRCPRVVALPEGLPDDLDLGLPGPHQRENAALALALVAASGVSLDPDRTRAALAETSWPARFQVIELPSRTHPVVIDGAHNPAAAQILVKTWEQQFPNVRPLLLFAGLDKKDTEGTYRPLSGICHRVILTETGTGRSTPVSELGTMAQKFSAPISEISDARKALSRALEDDSRPLLVAGSLFLAGLVLGELEKKTEGTGDDGAYQPSLQ